MFELHPTLAKDSLPIIDDAAFMIRLINDTRFPWVLIIPKLAGAQELHDLPAGMFDQAMRLSERLGRVMKAAFKADKINTAAIGNMVEQLHIHIVARHRDDTAWPAPVWGSGPMQPLSDAEAARRITLIRDGLAGPG